MGLLHIKKTSYEYCQKDEKNKISIFPTNSNYINSKDYNNIFSKINNINRQQKNRLLKRKCITPNNT